MKRRTAEVLLAATSKFVSCVLVAIHGFHLKSSDVSLLLQHREFSILFQNFHGKIEKFFGGKKCFAQ